MANTLLIYARYHNGAFDYLRCEVQDEYSRSLDVVEISSVEDAPFLAEIISEHRCTLISIQSTLETPFYRALRGLGVEVVSVRG